MKTRFQLQELVCEVRPGSPSETLAGEREKTTKEARVSRDLPLWRREAVTLGTGDLTWHLLTVPRFQVKQHSAVWPDH